MCRVSFCVLILVTVFNSWLLAHLFHRIFSATFNSGRFVYFRNFNVTFTYVLYALLGLHVFCCLRGFVLPRNPGRCSMERRVPMLQHRRVILAQCRCVPGRQHTFTCFNGLPCTQCTRVCNNVVVFPVSAAVAGAVVELLLLDCFFTRSYAGRKPSDWTTSGCVQRSARFATHGYTIGNGDREGPLTEAPANVAIRRREKRPHVVGRIGHRAERMQHPLFQAWRSAAANFHLGSVHC